MTVWNGVPKGQTHSDGGTAILLYEHRQKQSQNFKKYTKRVKKEQQWNIYRKKNKQTNSLLWFKM